MSSSAIEAERFDPLLLAILSNRFNGIVREMQNTLVRSGRSAVLNTARDFSCAILTSDHELVAAADGLPVHVFGMHLMTKAVATAHPAFAPGDAFLHNDPYSGGTHAADHTILVPVFVDGRVAFFSVARAHQADCGNSQPSTYMAFARDVYEEGSLIFPSVQIQRDGTDVEDVIRMCRSRIRVPDQWYGDYLAMIGAARIAETRLGELCRLYGTDVVRTFVDAWLGYSEDRMRAQIRALPAIRFRGSGGHDPLPGLEHGIPINVDVEVDPAAERIIVDLTDNIDCVPAGLNQSEASATANALTGVFNSLEPGIPQNAGSFRRVDIRLRENCVVGIPRFPSSCSVATTNLGARLVVTTQHAFAEAVAGRGVAEGACGMGPSSGVISGKDPARDGQPYVNQQIFAAQGGPAGPASDGWLTYGSVVTHGLMSRDSIEVVEQKYPILIAETRIRQDSEGAGANRGAPGTVVAYGPARGEMAVSWIMDGSITPPRGVRGGLDGGRSVALLRGPDGQEDELPAVATISLRPGETVVHLPNGGGGYGDPHDRAADLVRADVLAGFVSFERARAVYGVDFVTEVLSDALQVDIPATTTRRDRPRNRQADGGTAA